MAAPRHHQSHVGIQPLTDSAAGIAHRVLRLQRVRKAVPQALVLALFVAGAFALYRLLLGVDFALVRVQISATPWSSLAIALVTTGLSYAALVGYDWTALKYIGKPLPLRAVLAGGLLAYAFGNTLGLSAVSGGAVRYRIYSALGLSGFDVTRVSIFAAVSFGLSATLVGLVALSIEPMALGALNPIAPPATRLAAIAAAAAIIAPVIVLSFSGKPISVWTIRLRSISLPVLASQVAFSLLDITFSALTLYVLLPAGAPSFPAFLAVFATAAMVSVASHVPGGIGVFEAVVIGASPDLPLEKVAAALVLYRVTYYLIPFGIAVLALAMNELKQTWPSSGGPPETAQRSAYARWWLSAFGQVAPAALSAMVFGSGLWMTFATFIPAATRYTDFAEDVFLLAFVEGNALLSSAAGAALIMLAYFIARGVSAAFWIAIAILGAATITVLIWQPDDWERAAGLGTTALLLLPFWKRFSKPARLLQSAFTPSWLMLLAAVMFAGTLVIILVHANTPYSHALWWQVAVDDYSPRALRAGLVAALVLLLWPSWFLLRPPYLKTGRPQEWELEKAAAIISSQDDPGAKLALTGDKLFFFSEMNDAFIMFAAHGNSWIVLGGPVGHRASAETLVSAFWESSRRAGARAIFYEINEEDSELLGRLGMTLHKLGEEATVPLDALRLEHPSRKKLRAAYNKGIRAGLALEIHEPPHAMEFMRELRAISDEWLAMKKVREKQFSVGRFDDAWLNRGPVAVLRQNGRLVAFANLLTTDSRRAATVDLMRHSRDAPNGTMDFLFVALMLNLQSLGYLQFELGMAPFAGLDHGDRQTLWSRFGSSLYQHGGRFYNFAGLYEFKAKFDPIWSPRYIATPPRTPLMVALADVTALVSGGVSGVLRR